MCIKKNTCVCERTYTNILTADGGITDGFYFVSYNAVFRIFTNICELI